MTETDHTTDIERFKHWWWPYRRVFVVWVTVLLLILKIFVGNAAALALPIHGSLEGFKYLLSFTNRTYDFSWTELTEGEGSLFWIISVNGYSDDDPKNIAKFPLYPAVTRTVWDLTNRTTSVPLILSLLHGLMVWAGVAEAYRFWERYREGYGKRAVLWLLFSPLFVLHVWVASYVEPGFIALLWLSLTLERNRQWAAASAALLCLTLLQPSGIILACFIGVRRLYQWSQNKTPLSAVLWALLPGVMWVIWMVVTSLWFDRLLAPYAFQAEWGRAVYIWPWERWMEFAENTRNTGNKLGYVAANGSIMWIAFSYVCGLWLWLKLPSEKRQALGGVWVLPLFTAVIVLLPFSTSWIGANRYALTTLLGVWPLLFPERIQERKWFLNLERLIWLLSALMCFLILFAYITNYKHHWALYF